MLDPLVACILLTADRPEMTRRAIASFRAQTYQRKRLLILDSGAAICTPVGQLDEGAVALRRDKEPRSIGFLRNLANKAACFEFQTGQPLLIAHWDSDDISGPRRLEEQVALMEGTGAECVGYNEVLFWDTRFLGKGEAWHYGNPQPHWACGASLLYRRSLWERVPFADAPHEDTLWMRNPEVSRATRAISALCEPCSLALAEEPRLICGIHGGNTSLGYNPAAMRRPGSGWTRVPEWDAICAERMKL